MTNGYAAFLAAAFLIVLAFSTWQEIRKRDRINNSLIKKAYVTTEKHLMALVRKRAQLVQQVANGKLQGEQWTEEIRYFLLDHLRPSLSSEELRFFHEHFATLTKTIESTIETAILDQIKAARFANMAPPDFDQTKWEALLKCDRELAMVATKLRPLGQKWVDEFAASYLAINDKHYLHSIVSKIISDARREYEEQESTRGLKPMLSIGAKPSIE